MMLTKAVFAAWMHAYGYSMILTYPSVQPPALAQFGTNRPDVLEKLNFNRAYRKSLESRLANGLETFREEDIADALHEAGLLYRAWDVLDDCFRQPDDVELHLERLRGIIGPEAFGYGRMPPCVPIWRFQER